MSKVVLISVNGVRTKPGSDWNWNGVATTWVNLRTLELAKLYEAEAVLGERCEYPTLALGRWIKHDKWVNQFVGRLMRFHNEGWRIRVAGHSNAGNVIFDALSLLKWPVIEQLDLISPACESDLSYVKPHIGVYGIQKLRIWQAGRDRPLKWADNFVGRLLGYGNLGRIGKGPTGIPMDTFSPRLVELIKEPDFGHSTWFRPEEMDRTMQRITGLAT